MAAGAEIAVLRMDAATGSVDSNFSGDGRETYVHPPSGGQTFHSNYAADVISVSGGGYVLAGRSVDSVSHAVLLKILAGGTVDTTWGDSGWIGWVLPLEVKACPPIQAISLRSGRIPWAESSRQAE